MTNFIAWLKRPQSWVARVIQGGAVALVVIAVVVVSQVARGGGVSTAPTALRSPTAQQTISAGATTTASVTTTATTTAKVKATATTRPTNTTTSPAAPTATSAPTLTGSVSVVSASLPAPSGLQVVSTSASCPAGTTLVGGGFAVPNSSATPVASYPANATTWMVSADLTAGNSGTVFADCLTTSASITAAIVTNSNYTVVGTVPEVGSFERYDVGCSTGALTGGGYMTGFGKVGSADISAPDGNNGWMFEGLNPASTTIVYAICVSGSLTTSVVSNSTSAPAYPGSGSAIPFSVAVSCPAGRLRVSGGVGQPDATTQGQVRFATSQPDANASQWDAAGGNVFGGAAEEADVYAVCANL